jgi:hypothetical protein
MLSVGLEMGADPRRIARIFGLYGERGGLRITRALFEKNLAGKFRLGSFIADLLALLPPG